jgi:hypothetical protein
MLKTRYCRTAGSVVMVITALLALALPALAGNQVPFKGRADDMVTSIEVKSDGIHLTNAATGQATHLGRFTRLGSGIVHLDGTAEVTLVWTAANGDQLISNVVGLVITATTATGTYVFTGGTGRFENASGEADFVGVTSDGIHFDVAFNGTISSPGAR